jgi:phosphatidate cytidylyltransferase
MALNVVTFKTRALTALIFVAIMLAGLLWNQWSFFILFSVIHFGCWYEYQKLIALIDPGYTQITSFHKYGVMLAGWCFMLYCTNDAFYIGNNTLQTIGFWAGFILLFVLPIIEILFVRKLNLKNIGHSLLGLLYISLSLGLITNLRFLYGVRLDYIEKRLVLMIIGSIWINDTMAYIVGSLIGRTPLTAISPKKTWEGTIGGIILAIITMGVIGYFASSEFDWEIVLQWMSIAAIASIAGTFGDLLQSKLKRMAGVKDSGYIMPGHGGFLDRFDSLLLATPFVWLYIVIFM